ncbi:Fc.00g052720.m01.CDS01 [Cosmosporella sp. VM-42]
MALETLSAIGLAANVLQFLDYGWKLLSESREIFHSASGVTAENAGLETIAASLSILSDKLTIPSVYSSTGRRLDEEAIRKIAVSSKAIADELLSSIRALKRPNGRHRRWASVRQALEGIWNKDKIDQLATRLKDMRSQLSTHILAHVSKQQDETLEHLDRLSKSMGTNLSNRVELLRADLLGLVRTGDHATKLTLDDIAQRLSTIRSEADKLGREHRILTSLSFEHMNVRESLIVEAHSTTFQWIFTPNNWPSSDCRSEITFRQWLKRENGIYWISGKPGSGKSTLMRYLRECNQTRELLKSWVGNGRLVMPAFYFWISGAEVQKSQQGLLRQLLFEIFEALPDLIPLVCSDRWEGSYQQPAWTLSELLKTFDTLKQVRTNTSSSTKICFFIDGLDEYNGDPFDLIQTIRAIAQLEHVKLCVSSRPWNCFEEAFGRNPRRKLYLQDLTMDDIAKYARGKLEEMQISALFDYNRSMHQALVEQIVHRAEGVFLWVYLVVRSLRDGISNGDSLTLLQERLRELPSDLDEFFKRLIMSVDKVYRKRMSAAFQVALRAPQPLRLIQYRFLDEDDPESTANHLVAPVDTLRQSQDVARELLEEEEKIRRQLNGRYKGLLESPKYGNFNTVGFLHRTVRDYLMDEEMQNLFASACGPSFDVNTHACKALLAQAKVFPGSLNEGKLDLFMFWARHVEAQSGGNDTRLLDDMNRYYHSLSSSKLLDSSKFRGKAIQFGIVSYVDYIAARDSSMLSQDNGAALILSFTPVFNKSYPDLFLTTAITVLQVLLNRGANPNQATQRSTVFGEFLDIYGVRGPDKVLHHASVASGWDPRFLTRALPHLLSHGADISVAFQRKECWFSEILMYLDQDGHISRATTDHERELLRSLALFFEHGVDPNGIALSSHGAEWTLWETLLATVVASQINHGSVEGLCRGLMKAFLTYGANPRLRFSPFSEDLVAPSPAAESYSVEEVVEQLFGEESRNELEPVLRLALQRHDGRQHAQSHRKRKRNRGGSNGNRKRPPRKRQREAPINT